ncbi:MAG: NlpC/P60 family protein [Bacteroidota bacterium]
MPLQDFLGIPYRLTGRDRSGADCAGLVLMYLRSLGYRPPDGDGKPVTADWRNGAEERMRAWLSRYAQPVDRPQEGDIVLFRLPRGTMHLGVMVDDKNFLHVMEDRDSMLTPLRLARRRLAGLYRLKPEWKKT